METVLVAMLTALVTCFSHGWLEKHPEPSAVVVSAPER